MAIMNSSNVTTLSAFPIESPALARSITSKKHLGWPSLPIALQTAPAFYLSSSSVT